MRVALQRLTVETVSVDLPEHCPQCHASFRRMDALTEEQWVASAQSCQIVDGDAGPRLDDYTSGDDAEDVITVGYSCSACNTDVALPVRP
jgi:hypothetical protein